MKGIENEFKRDSNGRMYKTVLMPFDIGFAELHLAASLVPGVTKKPEEVTRAQVAEALQRILLSVGGNIHEIMWDTPDAKGIEDDKKRAELEWISYNNGYDVVVRLWPELAACPWAMHCRKGMD